MASVDGDLAWSDPWPMFRTSFVCVALLVATGAAAQDGPDATETEEREESLAISVLVESDDPAIESRALRAALSEALARPVHAVVDNALLTVVGVVSDDGPAAVQIIESGRTTTFAVPRGEPGWLVQWLSREITRRIGRPPPPSEDRRVSNGIDDRVEDNRVEDDRVEDDRVEDHWVEDATALDPPPRGAELAQTPVRTTGWLNLLSVPPATVTLGGQRIGTTPLVGQELPPGTHQLVLTTADGTSQTIDVTIESGRRTARALSIR